MARGAREKPPVTPPASDAREAAEDARLDAELAAFDRSPADVLHEEGRRLDPWKVYVRTMLPFSVALAMLRLLRDSSLPSVIGTAVGAAVAALVFFKLGQGAPPRTRATPASTPSKAPSTRPSRDDADDDARLKAELRALDERD
jgi:hypothetical protein